MDNTVRLPVLVKVEFLRSAPGRSTTPEVHENYNELILILKGEYHGEFRGDRINARVGDVIYYPQGEWHHPQLPQTLREMAGPGQSAPRGKNGNNRGNKTLLPRKRWLPTIFRHRSGSHWYACRVYRSPPKASSLIADVRENHLRTISARCHCLRSGAASERAKLLPQ